MTANISGCDPQQIIGGIIADVIADIATGQGCGGGCGGCDCGGCECDDCACDCSCSDCEGCAMQPVPNGFNLAHPNSRIANAAQVRASSTGLAYLSGAVGPLVDGVLPGVDLAALGGTGMLEIELANTAITAQDNICDGNASNGLPQDRDCVRAATRVNLRSCTTPNCATSEEVSISFAVASVGTLVCRLDIETRRGNNGLNLRGDLAALGETLGPRANYGRIAIMDGQLGSPAEVEGGDFQINSCKIDLGRGIDSAFIAGALAAFGGPIGLSFSVDCVGHDWWDPLCVATGRWEATPNANDLNAYKATIISEIQGQINNIIDYQIANLAKFCQPAPTAAACLPGTTWSGATTKTCIINNSDPDGNGPLPARCMESLLGVEARLDLGSILASISPGLNALVDLLFAAGGPTGTSDAVTAGGGYNINFFGGLENLSHDSCVPLLSPGDPGHIPTPQTSIPQVAVFQNNTRPGTGTPYHIGAAISEEFVNYALYKIWDSGMLCLTVSSALSSQLSPELLGPLLFGGTIDRFLFPITTSESYLGLSIRPQQPPIAVTEEVDDPGEPGDKILNVTITLPKLEIDFIFWTNDRYTRIATIQTNLSITLGLDIVPATGGDALKLGLGAIDFADTHVLNASTLLTEDELGRDYGAVLNGAAPIIAGTLAGAIPNIALEELINGLLGGGLGGLQIPLRIDFSADSIIPFEQGEGHPFVGIFFNFTSASGNPLSQRPETTVEVTSVTIPDDHTAFEAATLGQGALPRVEIAMGAEGPEGVEYEYSYRTTFSGWSEWSRSRYAIIEDAGLVLQQHQQVFARARIVGSENGTDFTSATADFTIDVTEPSVQVTIAPNGEGELQAYDFVYGTDLEYRVDGGDWKRIHGPAALGEIENDTLVEVRDGSGNVGSNLKLRGRGDPDAAIGGCGCATAGTESGSSVPGMLVSLVVLGLVISRRRRR